jgi:hypothetical protein
MRSKENAIPGRMLSKTLQLAHKLVWRTEIPLYLAKKITVVAGTTLASYPSVDIY